jgi:hypothetical protein
MLIGKMCVENRINNMSYDLNIWSSKKLIESNELLAKYGYQKDDDGFIREGKDWQVLIDESCEVEPEDIPDEIMQTLPGIAYLTVIVIEGARNNKKTIPETLRFCKALAKDINGVVDDQQTDTIILPAGVKKKFARSVSKDEPQEIYLDWYFSDIKDFYSLKVKQLIDLFDRFMPDALPKRYGEYEPPRFKLAEKGKKHLIALLQKEKGDVVLRPSKPFIWLFISVSDDIGHPYGVGYKYRCGCVELQMQQDAFLQPDWNLGVKRLFIETAKILQPFFAEIFSYSEIAENHTSGWWWRGLPCKLGYAAILNEQYVSQWDAFKNAATKIDDGLWMVDSKEVGEIPKEIMAPKDEEETAKFFPFKKINYNMYGDFVRWLDEVLEDNNFENVEAFNFNLSEGICDGTEEYYIELIGADKNPFRTEKKYLGERHEALDFCIKIIIGYLESDSIYTGRNKNKLLEKKAIEIGFADGDIRVIYSDGVIKKDDN